MHHMTATLRPFCFFTLLIDEVHLFFTDALPVEKFPSPVANALAETCRPLIVAKRIEDDLLPLANVDQVNMAHLRFVAYFIIIPTRILLVVLVDLYPYIPNE
jgi:hypothetical protein